MQTTQQIDALQYWLERLSNRSVETRRIYSFYFKRFCEWIDKSPGELIKIQKKAARGSGDRRNNMVLETKFKQWISELQQHYSIASCKQAYSSVVSFFAENQYPLHLSRSDRPSGESIGSRIPTKAEVRVLVNTAKSRSNRTVILFLKDSGLRLSDVVRIKWENLEDWGDGFHHFVITTKKRKIVASGFVGNETTDALKQLKRKSDRIFPLRANNLSQQITYIIRDSQVNIGHVQKLTAHGLRKFFNAELQSSRVPREIRYRLMGKKTSSYDENRDKKLFEFYRKAYSSLCVYGEYESEGAIRDLQEQVGTLNDMVAVLLQPGESNREELKQLIESKDRVRERLRKYGYVTHVEEKDGKRTLSTSRN